MDQAIALRFAGPIVAGKKRQSQLVIVAKALARRRCSIVAFVQGSILNEGVTFGD